MDLTEKMAFFEAYGAIAGAAGLKAMSGLLLPRGLLRMKESSEIRACAAIAIGKIRTAEARQVLQQAADDKDLVVKNAGGRALLLALYTALRSLKLYPVENATVQKALDDLDTSARALVALEADLEIRL